MPQNVHPCRALQTADFGGGRKHAWKRQDIRDQDKRREEICTRDHEDGTRAQNRKLGEQEDRGDRIAHEHRSQISREEGVDPSRLHARKQPDSDQDKDNQYAEHDRKSQPFLRGTRRQAREEETLFLRDNGDLSPASERPVAAARGTRLGRRQGNRRFGSPNQRDEAPTQEMGFERRDDLGVTDRGQPWLVACRSGAQRSHMHPKATFQMIFGVISAGQILTGSQPTGTLESNSARSVNPTKRVVTRSRVSSTPRRGCDSDEPPWIEFKTDCAYRERCSLRLQSMQA